MQVRAVNDAGDGPWSNSASAIAPVKHMPMFAEGATATPAVAENSPEGSNIGRPIAATDDDADILSYTLGGADATSFRIDSATGQLTTKASYTVTVTASDGNTDDDANITVTITVTDVAEGSAFSPYDEDDSGVIESTEVLKAVKDYFDGDITAAEVLAVVKLYFDGRSS